ncbi:MAG: hypothetical protein CVU49_01970 [Candidatus Cloacimonetes bacterium HGW-Cloacimonetes-2]|jgi:membrane protein required for colicin V production|nr:MAG: hypothetical protein CVU49_01970 [Candidatus Cloacimonetes bacterium HGW-Cloacimonetes-2]
MGIIDWVILVFLLFFLGYGFKRGFAAMLIQILGYIALFLLVGQYFPLVRNALVQRFSFNSFMASLVSFILISFLIYVLSRLVILLLSRTLKMLRLSFMNRLVGGIFGLINALLIVMIVTVVLDYIPKVSMPLKDKNRHVVYATVDQVKLEFLNTFSLKQHIKLMEHKVGDKLKHNES